MPFCPQVDAPLAVYETTAANDKAVGQTSRARPGTVDHIARARQIQRQRTVGPSPELSGGENGVNENEYFEFSKIMLYGLGLSLWLGLFIPEENCLNYILGLTY